MNSDNRYFMVSVKILQMMEDLKRAQESLERGLPLSAAAMLRCVGVASVETIEQTMTYMLSDPARVRPVPGCENHCGYESRHCGNPECKKPSGAV